MTTAGDPGNVPTTRSVDTTTPACGAFKVVAATAASALANCVCAADSVKALPEPPAADRGVDDDGAHVGVAAARTAARRTMATPAPWLGEGVVLGVAVALGVGLTVGEGLTVGVGEPLGCDVGGPDGCGVGLPDGFPPGVCVQGFAVDVFELLELLEFAAATADAYCALAVASCWLAASLFTFAST